MATLLSPGVNVTEIDLTTIVPSVSTSTGAFAGLFRWGPVEERVLVDSESQLVNRFAKPTTYNAETFFTAANFLSYTNTLYVVRAANTSGAVFSENFTANVVGNAHIFVCTNTSANLLAHNFSTNGYVTQSSNTSVLGTDGRILHVNSTAVVLNQAAADDTEVTLYFGLVGTSYSALGMEQDAVSANLVNQIVRNEEDYINKQQDSEWNPENGVTWIAKYPGAIGNSIRVGVVDNANQFASSIDLSSHDMKFYYIDKQSNTEVEADTYTMTRGSNSMVINFPNQANAISVSDSIALGDQIRFGNNVINYQYMKVTNLSIDAGDSANVALTINFEVPYRLHTAYSDSSFFRHWEFFNATRTAPGTSEYQSLNGDSGVVDEVHVVVVDEMGLFTGTPGEILEVHKGMSRATDAKTTGGVNNYYRDVINMQSKYIWWAADRPNAPSALAENLTNSLETEPGDYQFKLGSDGHDEATATLSTIASAYDLYRSTEDITIDIVLQGRPLGETDSSGPNGTYLVNFELSNYIIDNIVHIRRDCVVCVSPDKSMTLNAFGQEALSLVDWRGVISDSSYAVMDSGYKYQYDRYNDVYRWIPLNGDIGGLMARTDHTNDAWWSPAGFNRGQIKNLVKLAYNPRQADRDLLYVNGINPVVTFPGKGTVLFGDKTLQAKPSAFDRINVRRLFLVLERAISIASKYYLFEFNDQFTRSQFKNLVTPYLRTIQGRRGITDFLVVCDETNNTPQIIDSNQFVGDIYIKPARSINFIQLNFVAVATGVQFSEVVGQF